MLRSMTGYGAASGECDGVTFTVEIRSVNNRYFKPSIRLPEGWSALENDVERRLRETCQRGSVTCQARVQVTSEVGLHTVNVAALESYLRQLRPLEIEDDPRRRIDLAALMQLPGVCEPPQMDELLERTREGFFGVLAGALEQLMQTRSREGSGIAEDLDAQCGQILTLLETVARRSPRVVEDYHRRLGERVSELLEAGKVQLDADTLAREVAVFADRVDINEEIQRLRSHVEHFRSTMHSPEPAGRKMDFIAQEMLREANTIASKANDAEIGQAVVAMKTAIDRIKEQVQNVE
jgi:uncharacterized protein (TIGR00255 family)